MSAAQRPRLLLCAAVEVELEAALAAARRARRGAGREAGGEMLAAAFDVEALLTGVGKVSTAIELSRALLRTPAALVLQVGIAGAFSSSNLAPGDVVVSSEEILADEGVETGEGFLPLEKLGLGGAPWRLALPLAQRLPLEAIARDAQERYRVARGRTITVSTVTGTAARAAMLEALWSPLAESMEGAAAAFAAARAGCLFLEVRGISNLVGPRDRAAWEVERAAANAAEVALALALEVAATPGRGRKEAR